MRDNMQRKEFLRLSLFGAIATLIPVQELTALSRIRPKKGNDLLDIYNGDELARQAKIAFFQRRYSDAQNLYIEAIELAPSKIQYYDGLQNVYAVQKKSIEIIQLYKNGLDANTNIIVFYDRLARSLVRVKLGNKAILSQVQALVGNSALMDEAKNLYNQAINIDSSKQYLQEGLNRVNFLESLNADTTYANDNQQLKINKRVNREQFLSRYTNFSNQELTERLNAIDSKTRHDLFETSDIDCRNKSLLKEKKIIHQTLSDRCYKVKDYNQTLTHLLNIYNLDNTDGKTIKLLTNIYLKLNNFEGFLSIKRDWDTLKNTVWSKLGLIHALDKSYRRTDNSAYLEEAVNLSSSLFNDNLNTTNKGLFFKIAMKTAKLYRMNGQFSDALALYSDHLIYNEDFNNKRKKNAVIGYIKTLRLNGNINKAKRLLRLALKQKKSVNENNNDDLKTYLITKKIRKKQRLMFEYELYRIYEIEEDAINLRKTTKRILRINPKDKFLKRKSKQ